MVCWLMFLQRVSDSIKAVEPNLYKRKQLAIEVLKEIEFEESHKLERIKKVLEEVGEEGLAGRAKEIKKRRKKPGKQEEQAEEEMIEQEEEV